MKCIATIDRKTYLCEVSHDEIEKFMGLYYGKLGSLKVGDNVDLGKGFDFCGKTCDALAKTAALIESNKSVVDAIFGGITVMGRLVEQSEKETPA